MKKELIVYRDPKSPISEMFKNLRTNIQFMNASGDLKTLLITSTMASEGKSYISSNLAVTFAQAGKRVILVDADMRKGRQYSIFGLAPRPGMSNYLSGIVDRDFEGDKNNIVNFIQKTEIENLYLIAAGNVPPNPSELLVAPKMTKMINELKDLCDLVIFDGTPSLIVADPVILSRLVDTTIIVSAHNETKLDTVEKVKTAIEHVGGKVAGVVINKVPVSAKKYENSYYYGSAKSKNTSNSSKRMKSSNEDNELPKSLRNNTGNNVEKDFNLDTSTQDILSQINNYKNGDNDD